MPKGQYTTLIILALIVVVAVGGYFLIRPQYEKRQTLRAQVTDLERSAKTRQETIKKLEELEKNYRQAKAKVERLPEVLPKEAQIPEFLIQLEAIARETDMGFSSVSVSAPERAEEEGKPAYKTLNVSVTVAGSYSNLKRYLDAVEKNLRLADITSISFSATPIIEGGPADVFSYTVNMRTYYIE